jgi:aminoglycoside phosphotransferase (APT) family kinase protein
MMSSADRLPIAAEQRDFSPWNVFVTPGGELAAVDWESGDACGWPALDLIYFLTYVVAYRERAHTRDGLLGVHRASLSEAGEARRITARCLERYAALSGIPRDAIAPLRALCWLVHSHAEYRRLTTDRGAAPAPGELRDSLFAVLWEQEMRAAARLTAA